jgi:hypothetical protein
MSKTKAYPWMNGVEAGFCCVESGSKQKTKWGIAQWLEAFPHGPSLSLFTGADRS